MKYKKGEMFFIKVRGFDPETKRRIQEKLFQLGIYWSSSGATCSYLSAETQGFYGVDRDGDLVYSRHDVPDRSCSYIGGAKELTLAQLMAMEKAPEIPAGYEKFVVGAKIVPVAYHSGTTVGREYEITKTGFTKSGSYVVNFINDFGGESLSTSVVSLGDIFILAEDYKPPRPNKKFRVLTGDLPNQVRKQLRAHAEYLGYRAYGSRLGSNFIGLTLYPDGDYAEIDYRYGDAVISLKEFFRLEPEDCFK